MFVSVTRLRLRSWWFVFRFFRHNSATAAQLRKAAGFRSGATLIDRGWAFWTKTLWDSEQDMKVYRGSGAHSTSMPLLRKWCSESAVTHWTQPEDRLPSWLDAHRHLVEAPRFAAVDHPGSDHTARRIPEPTVSFWRDHPLS
ncbi:MAG: DUF3291 domain-containing protein [Bryobacteraceae bacterium]|nr:DUF3291 domain-containing protein [Bryobacteraceae bacterium]